MDGIGAIIIAPTRELALQTFEVLTKIGKHHEMSAGLIIGGSAPEREKAIVPNTNILVCTPGRLLQHMDETTGFHCDNLQMLVLDEADRILDMGFASTLNAIIENLPLTRQTLLFSATQTKSVKDLARLSLTSPQYISVHEKDQSATPAKLVQAYMEVPLHRKLDVLYSFIRSHTTSKVLVFVSSCKQVRFIYESLRRMRPGVPLLPLHGKQKQTKRTAIFNDFSKKKHAVLFATDIAARGLDFPSVDWVVQLDAPEDVATYIHRVGRTARFGKDGKALLLLLPTEAALVQELEAAKVKIIRTEANNSKLNSITPKLKGLCAEIPEVKYLAQKCFISYVRSVFLQPNKAVFKATELPTEEFAASLGLPAAPKIKFVKKAIKKHSGPSQRQALKRARELAAAQANSDDEDAAEGQREHDSKFDKLRKRKNVDVLSDAYAKLRAEEEDDEDDFLTVSKTQTHETLDDTIDTSRPLTRKQRKAKVTRVSQKKLGSAVGTRTVFDQEGDVLASGPRMAGVDVEGEEGAELIRQQKGGLSDAAKTMQTADELDKALAKEKLLAKKAKRKAKRRAQQMGGEAIVDMPTLGGSVSDDNDHDIASADESLTAKRSKREASSLEDEAERLLGMMN
eukprot:TRINITY_DN6692_c0_g1_i1.p1 TRINITY_DN6692_c0_g1~~TRINITY_DN6692_c0_g1_i1.p1  ORF type:complete len:731 (+),score=200.44 TRINITY_DN6692_c0_g1_i1:317-2194(+)